MHHQVHFVPLRPDFADLGTRLSWLRANPTVAASIARAGRVFLESLFGDDFANGSEQAWFTRQREVGWWVVRLFAAHVRAIRDGRRGTPWFSDIMNRTSNDGAKQLLLTTRRRSATVPAPTNTSNISSSSSLLLLARATTPSQTSSTGSNISSVCNHSNGRAFPTVFVLGAQKSGSTTLMTDMVQAMPKLLSPVIHRNDPSFYHKELHFFDKRARYDKGSHLLASYYPSCSEVRDAGLVPIDGTPDYFGSQGLPAYVGDWERGDLEPWERALEFYSQEVDMEDHRLLTFVIILRDPTARFVSAFHHMCRFKTRGGPYVYKDMHPRLTFYVCLCGECERI
jgi:hypothetical protein